jgi:hypothetical protein
VSLFSRLQSAHSPVRGHGEELARDGAFDAVALCAGRTRTEAESEDCDELWPHAPIVAHSRRGRGKKKVRAVIQPVKMGGIYALATVVALTRADAKRGRAVALPRQSC